MAVPAMEAQLKGLNPLWIVGKGEAGIYKSAGANRIVEGGNLIDSRNMALDLAFKREMNCVQLSDDLKGVRRAHDKHSRNCTKLTVAEAIELLSREIDKSEAKLAGVAPTSNPYFFNPKKPVRDAHFIVGDFIFIARSDPRFDTEMTLKEDYDFTLEHITQYGAVARCDFILAEFQHRTNAGGAVAYRTSKLEKKNIDYLKTKWGDLIKDNPRRPNEILLAVI